MHIAVLCSGQYRYRGGCLASQHLAGWTIARLDSIAAAEEALSYVAPVAEKEEYVSRAIGHILPFLPERR